MSNQKITREYIMTLQPNEEFFTGIDKMPFPDCYVEDRRKIIA